MAENSHRPQGEDGWIASWLEAGKTSSRNLLLGPGHDCAWLQPPPSGYAAVLKSDATLEGVHFKKGERPELAGRKAVARVLSDFAATGAIPVAMLISVILRGRPDTRQIEYVRRAYTGMGRLLRDWNVVLAG